jgi:ABC-type bacteriocin/lantibiotic exporter with double-glycine peptidase domain
MLKPYKRLIRLIQMDKKDISQIFIYAVFLGLTNLTLPLGIQAIINLIQMGEVSTSWIVLVFLVVAGIVFGGILQLMQLRITENLQQKIFIRASFEFAYRIPRFNLSALRNLYAPELVNRFFDTTTIQKGLPKLLIDISTSVLQIVFSLILLSLYHPFFIIFSFILLSILVLLLYFKSKKGLETSIKESTYKFEIAHWLEEIARSMNTFKLKGKTNLHLQKTDKLVQSYVENREKHFRVLIIQFIQLIGFKSLIALFLLLIGGILVINQQLNIGQFIAAEIIILLVISSVEKIILNIENIYDVLTAVDKLGSITDLPLENQHKSNQNNFVYTSAMSLEMKSLNFKYPNQQNWLIKDINIQIAPKQHTLFLGDLNSAKSALVSVFSSLYPIESGLLLYNQVNVNALDLEVLRSHIGYFTKDQKLFLGTLLDNIAMGSDIPMKKIMDSIEIVGLTNFFKTLDFGFETELFSSGIIVTRNIEQRILLARSIIHEPKLLLIENIDSILNEKSNFTLIEKLFSPEMPWTIVAVSDVEFGINNFKQFVYMYQGMIDFTGTQAEYLNFKK